MALEAEGDPLHIKCRGCLRGEDLLCARFRERKGKFVEQRGEGGRNERTSWGPDD